jgi:hypothetical protein
MLIHPANERIAQWLATGLLSRWQNIVRAKQMENEELKGKNWARVAQFKATMQTLLHVWV